MSSTGHPEGGFVDDPGPQRGNNRKEISHTHDNGQLATASDSLQPGASRSFGIYPSMKSSLSPHSNPSNALWPQRRRRPALVHTSIGDYESFNNQIVSTRGTADQLGETPIGSPESQSSDVAPQSSTQIRDSAYDAIPGVTVDEASTVQVADRSPTLSDLDLRRQLSGTTDVDSISNNPYFGGDFNRSFNIFSSPRPSNASSLPRSLSDDTDYSIAPPSESSPPDNAAATSLEEEIQSLRMANLNLQSRLIQSESVRRRLQSLQTDYRRTLQAYRIIPRDDAQPVWKLDSDGTRTGPLYDDIPNIYRESTVELLINRAALRLMIADFDTMFNVSIEALSMAERLRYPSLTARCRFVNAVALYHKRRFNEALDGFYLAYGADQYGINTEYVTEWCDGCTNALDSSFSDSSGLAVRNPSERPTGSSESDVARRLWGSPGTPRRRWRARTTSSDNSVATAGAEDLSEGSTLASSSARTIDSDNSADGSNLMLRIGARVAAQRKGETPASNPTARLQRGIDEDLEDLRRLQREQFGNDGEVEQEEEDEEE